MAIMVAGGLTFAIPGIEPAMAEEGKTANLYVSSTTFGGAMILEIVVNDPNLRDTDELEGEPTVRLAGDDIRMVQSTDGLWYAYVGESAGIAAFDKSNTVSFGTLLNKTAATNAIFGNNGTGFDAPFVIHKNSTSTVLENAKEPTRAITTDNNPIPLGQIGIKAGVWPFIQVFDDWSDDSKLKLEYNAGGANQVINITYDQDMDDFASYSLDRQTYPHEAEVHMVINDAQLNIDPTVEDIWTFNVNGTETFYGLYDTSGKINKGITLSSADTIDLTGSGYGDNGALNIDVDPQGKGEVVNFENNQYQSDTTGLDTAENYVTFQETTRNSNVFDNTDTAENSSIQTVSTSNLRGVTFTVDYNDETSSYVLDYTTGTVIMDKSSITDTWSSGEPLTVNISDADFNKNTLVEDDFSVSSNTNIPVIQIGNPITLEESTNVKQGNQDIITNDVLTKQVNAINKIRENINTLEDQLGLETLKEERDAAEAKIKAQKDIINSATNSTVVSNARTALSAAETELSDIQQTIRNVEAKDDNKADFEFLSANRTNLATAERQLENLKKTNSLASEFSKILNIQGSQLSDDADEKIVIETNYDSADLNKFIGDKDGVLQYINYDLSSFAKGESKAPSLIIKGSEKGSITIANADKGLELIESSTGEFEGNLIYEITPDFVGTFKSMDYPIAIDIFTFGQDDDNRYNDAIYRLEAEETADNTGIYTGTVEYIMLNQINIFDSNTYIGLATIDDELDIIVHEDLTDEDAVEVSYYDTDGQGVSTLLSAQEEAPTHSAVVSFDGDSYKVADTVTITLEDADLNTDSDVVDIYTTVQGKDTPDKLSDTFANAKFKDSLLLDVTFDDRVWAQCDNDNAGGLSANIGTLRETSKESGIFTATFQIPDGIICVKELGDNDAIVLAQLDSVTGLDMEVNYQDFRDASGEEIEVGDSAGVRASTGSISLDRTVYPVPFGTPSDFATNNSESPDGRSLFPVHATGLTDDDDSTLDEGEYLASGDLIVHIRVNDPDFDTSASGQDEIAKGDGVVEVKVIRGSDSKILTPEAGIGSIDNPITEIAPDAGVFEYDLRISYDDGPASSCPASFGANSGCILQGDILQVEYRDPTDASGDKNTITDSATFDLRNGALQTDKSVYIIGSDMILTLIEPDFDLDNDQAETYNLDLIEWDSDAATVTMGNLGGEAAAFDPEPSNFRETGDSTGIFQIVVEIPESLDGDRLERGEEIVLEYTDWGPSGANYVGDEDEDVNLTVFTSNFGATIELDQKVYTWTDKVFITIVAPDHNFDGDLIDEIGNSSEDPLKISTRGHDLDEYKLVETGTDTGIFTGEVILTGFQFDADGDGTNDITTPALSADGSGPTDGFLPADDDDGITVSFEFSEDETVVGSALIRWNIGEVQWLEASYPATGTGVVRIIDPDMNLDPEAVDNFDVDVWSDSDAGGIDLTVTETNEATGIFEGTVFFTVADESSGHRLRVAEGDTVTAEYEDNTLPDPYTTADELDITATSLIGTVVPPLERAPAANLRTVDAFGNSLDSVSVDQQVQITADLNNGQDRTQEFAYLVQIQDANGVTASLAWITGSLTEGQSFSPALSWIPEQSGSYTATAFVWESVDNPTALSPPVSTTVSVS
jgi:hypothetical protein